MHRPVIVIMLSYLAGLLLGHGYLYFPYSISILSVTALLALAVLTRQQHIPVSRFLLRTVPAAVGMAAYLYSAAWLPANHYTRSLPEDRALHELSGTVVSPLDRDPDRTAFVLDLSAIDGIRVAGKVRVSVREALTSIGYGDSLRLSGRIFSPTGFENPGGFDYAAYLARSGIYRTVSVKNGASIRINRPGRGLFRTIQDWRERIRQAFLTSTHGPGSAILQAMVLGEEGSLTDQVRDQFMAAGVTHIISISGSHLGMLAILCFGLVRAFMRLLPERRYLSLTLHVDPKKAAALLTLPLVLFYTFLAGGQVATVRSLLMIMAALGALLLDREHALMPSLAAAALCILIAGPQALFDISFQLSFISVLSIGYVVSVWNSLGIRGENVVQRIRKEAVLFVVISLSASIATGPFVARYFNQISLAGIVANMVVVPFAGMVVVPLGLFSGIASLFTHHLPLATLNQFVADRFIEMVGFFSRLPASEFHPPAPGVFWLLGYGTLIIMLARLIRGELLYRFKPFEHSGRTSRAVLLTAACAGGMLLVLSVHPLLHRGGTEVAFPDVGQGDSALVRLSTGESILIDGGGTADNRFDIGRRVLAPWLWNKGVHHIDLVVLSHPHPDHMNGLKFILRKFAVTEVWTHGHDGGLPGYDEFNRILLERGIRRGVVSASTPPLQVGGANVRVLHPARDFRSPERRAYSAENDRSLVIRIADRDGVFLFGGDIGRQAERALLRSGQNLRCNLLKVPHHGSKTSSSEAFLSAIRPAVAVITVGRRNSYHHPSGEVLARYERFGTRIFRTDRDGAVRLRAERGSLKAVTWHELEMRRVERDRDRSVWQQERENGKRLYLRRWEL